MKRTLLRNARPVSPDGTGAAQGAYPPLADIAVEANRIAEILPAGSAVGADREIDLAGAVVVPGLINGHFHSHEHFQKGRSKNLPLELWMNSVRPPRPIPLTERQVYLRTLVGAIEAIRSGTTTVIDDLNVGPTPNRRHLDAVLQAYADSGLRALVGISMMDRPFFESVPFVDEEFDASVLASLRSLPPPDAEAYLALCRQLAHERHPRSHRVGFIVAPSAPQRCTLEFLRRARALADEFDLPSMMHVQETRLQVVTAQIRFGKPMVEYLAEHHLLGPKTTLIHGVWLTPREIEVLARSGTTIQHNPWSNLRLGSGVAPLRALLDAGVNVSLGTDGCGSTDTCNMLNAVGLMSVLHTLRGDDHSRWIGANDAWYAGTVGGARALGREGELGTLAPGALADLVAYRSDSITLQPLNDPLQQLASAERGGAIRLTMVDGEVIHLDGELCTVDERAIVSEIEQAFDTLRTPIREAELAAAALNPSLERIYRRCLRQPIPLDVHPARL